MKVVLKHAGRWLHFCNPVKVLCTERIDEVLPLLREAEQSGFFVAGCVAYEAASAFDPALQTRHTDGFPLLHLGLFHPPDVLGSIEKRPGSSFSTGALTPSVSKSDFIRSIAAIKQHISAGATYQVNYSYRLTGTFAGDPWAFFHALVNGQKAEYAAYADTDEFCVCSASPELFFRFSDGRIVSRPMKGTAPRGRTYIEDCKQQEALRSSEKDRAENIMIVDMIRNDIGRIARPGSVETVSTYDIEKYPTVWQMTSTVRGILAPEISNKECQIPNDDGTSCSSSLRGEPSAGLSRIMKALFPCASITGAPKAKTMEIIRELETTPRRIYTGTIGFMSPTGESSFNVAIRTALVDKRNGLLEYGIGGGVVWDSDPENEFEETLIKARVLTHHRPDFRLLETMLWEPAAGIFVFDEHMKRLAESAAYFDIPVEVSAIEAELNRLLAGLDASPHRLRLLVSRDGKFDVQYFPMDSGGAQAAAPRDGRLAPPGTVRVAVAKQPVNSQDLFLYHKTTHRKVYEQAKADFPGCDDVILWNERNEVTESTVANIVIRRNGKLITPPLESGLLAGAYRAHLLNRGEIEEGVVTVEDLHAAAEVFLVNSVRKWHKAVWAE